jgi:hypothetical protein
VNEPLPGTSDVNDAVASHGTEEQEGVFTVTTNDRPAPDWGIIAGKGEIWDDKGGWDPVWAVVEPAPTKGWRPWPRRWYRWYYEIEGWEGVDPVSFFGTKGGVGGGFTLHGCMNRALNALARLEDESFETSPIAKNIRKALATQTPPHDHTWEVVDEDLALIRCTQCGLEGYK